MDKLKIYQKIRELAHRGGTVYTRADLAYELQNLGIPNDCFEVGIFVWEAYRYFNQDAVIRDFFYDNERKGLLVDEYQTDGLISENELSCLFEMERQRLMSWSLTLAAAEESITAVMREDVVRKDRSIASTIIGTQGVKQVKQEAAEVFNRYSSLVGHYGEARQQIELLIADFVKLRAYICDVYRRYSLVLVDIFGDSIKSIDPELFDFEAIGYLDVHDMLHQVQLDYNSINEKCFMLMSDISDSFAQSLKTSGFSYRSVGNKKVGLVLAGLKMLSHYMQTGKKVANLKQELLFLKNSVNHDVSLIKGDLGRLCVIYKSLNDVSVPEAEGFCKFSEQVLTEEWKQLTESLYDHDEVRKLKEERDELLIRLKEMEQEMNDEEINITNYLARVEESRRLLDSMQAQYQEARQAKPSKPFFLINLLTFGTSNKTYNRKVYNWNLACKPVITQYENLQVDVKLDTDELTRLQAALKTHQAQYTCLKQNLREQNRLLMKQIRVNKDIRIKMLPHLETMVNLLRLGRQIANTKLDDALVKTITVSRQNLLLPEKLKQRIEVFSQAVRQNVNAVPQLMQNMVTSVKAIQQEQGADTCKSSDNSRTAVLGVGQNDSGISGPEHAEWIVKGNQTVQDLVAFLEAAVRLEVWKAKSAIAEKEYNQELASLQNRFREYLTNIDCRSAVLRKSLQQINTAQNHEALKNGILSLIGDSDDLIQKEDLEEFLNGNKIMEL